MNARLMFTINAVVLAIFGLGFLLVPDMVLAQFDTEMYVIVTFLSRFFGATLILSAGFLWLLKDLVNAKTEKNITLALMLFSIGGFALTIMGVTSKSIGVIRANGWILLAIYGLFALVYGYLYFLQPKESKSRSSSKK